MLEVILPPLVLFSDTNNCTSTDSQEVTVENCANIIDHESAGSIKIYPNPNSGIFNIALTNRLQTNTIVIRIITGQGKQVYMEELKPVNGIYTKQADLSGYPAGIYYIQVVSDGGAFNQKIVIE